MERDKKMGGCSGFMGLYIEEEEDSLVKKAVKTLEEENRRPLEAEIDRREKKANKEVEY